MQPRQGLAGAHQIPASLSSHRFSFFLPSLFPSLSHHSSSVVLFFIKSLLSLPGWHSFGAHSHLLSSPSVGKAFLPGVSPGRGVGRQGPGNQQRSPFEVPGCGSDRARQPRIPPCSPERSAPGGSRPRGSAALWPSVFPPQWPVLFTNPSPAWK